MSSLFEGTLCALYRNPIDNSLVESEIDSPSWGLVSKSIERMHPVLFPVLSLYSGKNKILGKPSDLALMGGAGCWNIEVYSKESRRRYAFVDNSAPDVPIYLEFGGMEIKSNEKLLCTDIKIVKSITHFYVTHLDRTPEVDWRQCLE